VSGAERAPAGRAGARRRDGERGCGGGPPSKRRAVAPEGAPGQGLPPPHAATAAEGAVAGLFDAAAAEAERRIAHDWAALLARRAHAAEAAAAAQVRADGSVALFTCLQLPDTA
jgi:hypothetical protein